jgi:hypothetical protein
VHGPIAVLPEGSLLIRIDWCAAAAHLPDQDAVACTTSFLEAWSALGPPAYLALAAA